MAVDAGINFKLRFQGQGQITKALRAVETFGLQGGKALGTLGRAAANTNKIIDGIEKAARLTHHAFTTLGPAAVKSLKSIAANVTTINANMTLLATGAKKTFGLIDDVAILAARNLKAIQPATKAVGAGFSVVTKVIGIGLLKLVGFGVAAASIIGAVILTFKAFKAGVKLAFQVLEAGVKAAITAMVAFTGYMAKSFFEVSRFNRELLYTSEVAGISVSNLSIWDTTMRRFGGNLKDVTGAASTLNMALKDIGAGQNEQGAQALKDIGLPIEQLLRLDPETQLRKVTSALNNSSTSQLANARATIIAGDSYAGLLPLLTRAVSSYNDIAKESAAAGLTVTRSAAENSAEALAAWTSFGDQLKGAINSSIAQITPKVTELLNTLKEFGPVKAAITITRIGGDILADTLAAISNITKKIGSEGVADTLVWAWTQLANVTILPDITKLEEIGTDTGPFGQLRTQLTSTKTSFGNFKDAFSSGISVISILLGALAGDDSKTAPLAFSKIRGELKMTADSAKDNIGEGGLFDSAFSYWGDNIDTGAAYIAGVFGGLADTMAGVMNIAWGLIIGDTDQAMLGLLQIFQGTSNIIIAGGEWLVDSVHNIGINLLRQTKSWTDALKDLKITFTFPSDIEMEKKTWGPITLGYVPKLDFSSRTYQPFGGLQGFSDSLQSAIDTNVAARNAFAIPRATFADDFERQYLDSQRDALLGTNFSGLNDADLSDAVRRHRQNQFLARNPGFIENAIAQITGGGSSGDNYSLPLEDDGLIREGDPRRVFYNIFLNQDVTTEQGKKDNIVKVIKEAFERGEFEGTPFGGLAGN